MSEPANEEKALQILEENGFIEKNEPLLSGHRVTDQGILLALIFQDFVKPVQ